jgi:peptidoglycan/LPS O-acetylase OafA/YrhL
MTNNNQFNNSPRVSSLDVLRSIAILLVIVFHYQVFVSHQNNFGVFSQVGWIGVDLFFVLSGYLISNQIFFSLKQENFSLKKFYIKRFFKTLPNYYFVLALYLLIPCFAELPLSEPSWKYLFFIQNFNLPPGGFSQSWSLCVEEQFYLIFPFAAIWLCRKNHRIFITFAAIVIFGILLRAILWQYLYQHNILLKAFTKTIYYPTYCRLDGFIAGISVAYLQNYSSAIWQRLIKHGNLFFLLGLIMLIGFITICFKRTSFLSATLVFPGLALSFALIVFSALSPDSFLTKIHFSAFGQLARWSYAIYLLQKPISVLCATFFTHIGLNNNSYLVIFINIAIQILVGCLMFYCIENKFMQLRDKFLYRSRPILKVDESVEAV